MDAPRATGEATGPDRHCYYNRRRNILAMLVAAGDGGATLAVLFGGIPPTWAITAVGALETAGFIERNRLGVYTLTPAGRKAAASDKPPRIR
jgi:hypothetical protein